MYEIELANECSLVLLIYTTSVQYIPIYQFIITILQSN